MNHRHISGNSTTSPTPSYNPYHNSRTRKEKFMSEFSDMETYVDSSGFSDNTSLINASGTNALLPREVALHRAHSARVLNGLARGDSIKRVPQLDRVETRGTMIDGNNNNDDG
ncbi:11075_t:CDS:1, partial [Ambispora leptoticha]